MDSTQAACEAARRRVKRATGLLSEAARDLAAATGGQTTLGVVRVHDTQSAIAAHDLIEIGVGRHGAVDVIVVARPRPRPRTNPPRPQ